MTAERRRGLLATFGCTAALLMMGSAANACIVFKGNLTVSGNGPGSVTQTVTGLPIDGLWCPVQPLRTVKVRSIGASIVVATGASSTTDCPVPSKLADGVYNVNWRAGEMLPFGQGNYNCHGRGANLDRNFTVSGGNGVGGPTSYSYIPGVGVHSVCIYKESDPSRADGIAINIDAI